MGDIYKKVQSGSPLNIPAHTWNDLLDMLRWAKDLRNTGGALPRFLAHYADIRYVRNDTGGDLSRCSVVGIEGAVYTPTANLLGWKNTQTFKGVTPVFPTHEGNFAVLIEPIASTKLGRAIFSGLAPVQVSADSGLEWYGYADITHNATSTLTMLPSGGAKVEYREAGASAQWAAVQIGPGGHDRSFWGKAQAEIEPGASGTVDLWHKSGGGPGQPDEAWADHSVTAVGALNTDIAVPAAPSWCSVTWFRDYRLWYAAGCPQSTYYY